MRTQPRWSVVSPLGFAFTDPAAIQLSPSSSNPTQASDSPTPTSAAALRWSPKLASVAMPSAPVAAVW